MTSFNWNDVTRLVNTKAIFAAAFAGLVVPGVYAQTTIVQSNVGSGCSSVCVNGNCTTTCNGEVTKSSTAFTGNGDIQQKDIDLTGFTSLALTDLDASVKFGQTSSVKVVADSNLLDKVLVRLDGDQLVARLEDGHYQDATISLEVVMPDLVKLNQFGSNTVQFSGFNQSMMDLQMTGAGAMTGRDNNVETLRLAVNGAGNADMLATELTEAAVTIDGSADVRLNFTAASSRGEAKISGVVNGVASIEVCGDPANTVQLNGVADIYAVDC